MTTGVATVGGEPCVLVGFEFAFLGGSMGTAEGARIVRAFSVAVAERLPMVCVSASGGSRMQEGTSALLQTQAVATAIAAARRAGIPHIAVAGDPTTGGVWSSLIADADLLISVPGAQVSFSGSRTRPGAADPGPPNTSPTASGRMVSLTCCRPCRNCAPGSPPSSGCCHHGPAATCPAGRRCPPGQPATATATDGPPGADAWTHISAARSPCRARADRWLAGYFGPTVRDPR